MKKILFFVLMIFTSYASLFAQSNSTCATAAGFCTGDVINYPASVNAGSAPSGPNYGCLLTQPNPSFYLFQIANGGNMTIHIVSQSSAGSARDVDFIVWGPFATPNNCNNLNTIESCSYSTAAVEDAQITGAIAGEYYVMMVTNFANQASNINFSQTAGSATTNCQVVCNFNIPATICQTSGNLTLANYLSSTTATTGNFTGTGVSGGVFNPTGLSGNITVTYTVSSSVCTDVINVGGGTTSTWNAPSNVCASGASVNLTPFVTGTAGGTWSGTGVSGTSFNPAGLSGNISVTYTTGPAGCTSSTPHNISVIADVNPAWTPPAPMCDNAGSLTLSSLVTGTPGGSWSGTGVSGGSFNPAGLSGNQAITYTVGTAPCQETSTQNISVSQNVTATWAPPAPVCASAGTIELNNLITTGTTGGTWTGTNVSAGHIFDPTGLSGPIAITYTVGSAPCSATSTQNITVNPVTSATWTSPASVCVNGGVVNLTTYITGTTGGTWSGTNVAGNFFDPAGLAGTSPSITYTTGSGSCQNLVSHNIPVISVADPSWAPPASLCTGSGVFDLSTVITGTLGGTWSGTGVSTPNFDPAGLSGPQAITYIVGSGACAATSTQNITVNPSTTATWTNPGPICVNAVPISLDPLVTSGGGTAGGTWSGGGVTANNFDPAGLGGTAAVVTYTVGSGACQSTLSQSIVINSLPDASWTPPAGMCTGSAALDLSTTITGTPGGTWSGTGVTDPNFDPAGLSGPQAVTYTATNGTCTATSTQNITVNPTTTPTWTNPGPICVNAVPVNLDPLVISGGGTTGGTWSGGGVTASNFDPAGLGGTAAIVTYTVGSGACQTTLSQSIVIDQLPDATWTAPAAMCTGSAILDLNTTLGGTSTTGGTWSGTGVTNPNFDPAGLSGPQAVTYTVTTGSCTASSTQNITINPTTTATWTNPGSICVAAGTQNLNPLVVSGGGTTGGTWSGPGVTSPNFDPAGMAGTSISLTYTVGLGACQSVLSQVVVIDPIANASWTTPGAVCVNSSVLDLNTTLTTAATLGGTWSGTGITASPNFDPTGLSGPQAITYSVGTGACAATSTQNINVLPVVSAAWTSFGTVCENSGIINLNTTVTGNAGGVWSGSTAISGNIFDPTGLGSQTINIVYTVGTAPCQDVLSQPITITSPPSSTWTNPGTQCQGNAALDLNNTVTGLAGGTWTIDGVPGNIFDPSALALGAHNVSYTAGTTCQQVTTQTIIVGPQVSAAWNAPSGFCTVAGVTNLNTLITGTTGGVWSGQGVTGNIFDPAGLTGNITITYLAGTVVGCQDGQSNIIAVLPDVDPAWNGASLPTYCANDSILDLNSLITGTAGGTWSGSGITGSNFNPAGLSGPITITYDVGAAPCNETSVQVINVITPPAINVTAASVQGTTCLLANGSITGITASVAPLTYEWTTSNGDIIGTGADVTGIPNGVYTLQVTNASGCNSVTNSYFVGNTTLVNAGFTTDVITGNVPLAVHFTDTSYYGYTFSWDFGNSTTSTAENPVGNFYVAGEYDVLLTVHDSLGCVDTASIKIVVTEEFVYTIPNVFSPNGDSSNDVFFVGGTGIKDVSCKIFNRWGQFIFEWTGPKGGWDGNTLSGATAPDGVYFYMLEITDKDGKQLDPIQDYVTLVR